MVDRPRARREAIVSEPVGDERVLYDTRAHVAHSLPATVARVWELCDGERSAVEIARVADVSHAEVEHALAELRGCGLLAEPPAAAVSRREFSRRAVRFGGAATGAGLILSVGVAPAAASASLCSASCANNTPIDCTKCGAAAPGSTGASASCTSGLCFSTVDSQTFSQVCTCTNCVTLSASVACGPSAPCCNGTCVSGNCIP